MTVRILQLTDLHLSSDPKATLKDVSTHDVLFEVLDHIRTIGCEFDRVVVTGDMAHDEATSLSIHGLVLASST
jgi:Icc protein